MIALTVHLFYCEFILFTLHCTSLKHVMKRQIAQNLKINQCMKNLLALMSCLKKQPKKYIYIFDYFEVFTEEILGMTFFGSRNQKTLSSSLRGCQSCTHPHEPLGTGGKHSQMTDPRVCVERSEAAEGSRPTETRSRWFDTHTHTHERSALTRRLPDGDTIQSGGGVIFPQFSCREKVSAGPEHPPESCSCSLSLIKVSSRVNLPLDHRLTHTHRF